MYCDLMPEFFESYYPKARKTHRCCECGGPIHPGEKYGVHSGKWDGEFDSFKQHLDCEEACVFIRNNFTDGECIGFGTLKDEYKEFMWNDEKKSERQIKFRNIMAKIINRCRKDRIEW